MLLILKYRQLILPLSSGLQYIKMLFGWSDLYLFVYLLTHLKNLLSICQTGRNLWAGLQRLQHFSYQRATHTPNAEPIGRSNSTLHLMLTILETFSHAWRNIGITPLLGVDNCCWSCPPPSTHLLVTWKLVHIIKSRSFRTNTIIPIPVPVDLDIRSFCVPRK